MQRQQLRADYRDAPVSLGIYLGATFIDAVVDLPDVPGGDLYQRFVGWSRRRRQAWAC